MLHIQVGNNTISVENGQERRWYLEDLDIACTIIYNCISLQAPSANSFRIVISKLGTVGSRLRNLTLYHGNRNTILQAPITLLYVFERLSVSVVSLRLCLLTYLELQLKASPERLVNWHVNLSVSLSNQVCFFARWWCRDCASAVLRWISNQKSGITSIKASTLHFWTTAVLVHIQRHCPLDLVGFSVSRK